ncbi:MAG: hypothetical protein AVDCRST_MAG55-2635, partial [uncultured Rubrobacteraceae bacterium]
GRPRPARAPQRGKKIRRLLLHRRLRRRAHPPGRWPLLYLLAARSARTVRDAI